MDFSCGSSSPASQPRVSSSPAARVRGAGSRPCRCSWESRAPARKAACSSAKVTHMMLAARMPVSIQPNFVCRKLAALLRKISCKRAPESRTRSACRAAARKMPSCVRPLLPWGGATTTAVRTPSSFRACSSPWRSRSFQPRSGAASSSSRATRRAGASPDGAARTEEKQKTDNRTDRHSSRVISKHFFMSGSRRHTSRGPERPQAPGEPLGEKLSNRTICIVKRLYFVTLCF